MSSGPVPARYPGFDGLRALAAIAIVAHHSAFDSGYTYWGRFGALTSRLDIGVSIFFVLSGFLLFSPFARAVLDHRDPPSPGAFYLRRAVRIFPAFWVALGFAVVFGSAVRLHGAGDLFWSATLLHSYVTDRAISGLTQSWSLVAELAFYASLPPLTWLVGRRLRAGTEAAAVDRRACALLGWCAGLYVTSLAFRGVIHLLDPSFERITPQWIVAQADQFALGMGLAVLRVWGLRRPVVGDLCQSVGSHHARWWAAGIAAYLFGATQLGLPIGLVRGDFLQEALRQGLYGLVGLCLVAPLALAPLATGRGRSLLDSAPLRFLGTLSYGIYLWHQSFLTWMSRWFGWPDFAHHFGQRFVGALVLSVGAAWLSHRLVEQPLHDRVARRQNGRRAAALPSPAMAKVGA